MIFSTRLYGRSSVVFDCFPFFNELDLLEIRLHELSAVVDQFIIVEAGETYGGAAKPFHLAAAWDRFKDFHDRMSYIQVPQLQPYCQDRLTGRLREADQRNLLWYPLMDISGSARDLGPDDLVIFSDLDEIPSGDAVLRAIPLVGKLGTVRFKQHSYYYNVHTQVDYGHDFASRARIGTVRSIRAAGSMYRFRMSPAEPIENGGWHFSYFGGPQSIRTKVAAVAPFLEEYKLFGDAQLAKDIEERRDLHHRRCEMPETFIHVQEPLLPRYLAHNRDRFSHFFKRTATV